MEKNFYDVVKGRRSYYGIGKEVVVSHDKIQEIVEHAVKYVPSAFNSQTTRVLVLLDNANDDLWNLTMEVLRKVVPADQLAPLKIKSTLLKLDMEHFYSLKITALLNLCNNNLLYIRIISLYGLNKQAVCINLLYGLL